jgi:uncharacterized protein
MNIETLEILIKKYLALRFEENVFFWQGGEPLLAGIDFFKQSIKFQEKYGHNQVIGNAIQTNGLLITDEWAELLNKYKFLVGISLDGPEWIHDPYRGKGTHKQVVHAMEILKKNNVEFNILTVLHKGNAENIREIYSYLKTLPTNFFQFIPALDNNPLNNSPMDYSITPELYQSSLCKLFDIWYPNDIQKISIRDFDAIINGMFGLPKGVCSAEKECSSYIVVENEGDVYPCDFFVRPAYILGNILENSFEEMLRKRTENFSKIKMQVPKSCKVCIWLPLCQGGCIKDRIYADNDQRKRTYFCTAYQEFFRYSFHRFINIINLLAKQHQYRSGFIEKIKPENKCPCGSGLNFKDCSEQNPSSLFF